MKSFFSILVVMLFGCRTHSNHSALEIGNCDHSFQKVENVSLGDFDKIEGLTGKFVSTEGYFYAAFEDCAIYSSQHSTSSTRKLWLNFAMPDTQYRKFSTKRVRVIGKVNVIDPGHFHADQFELDSVYCIKELVD